MGGFGVPEPVLPESKSGVIKQDMKQVWKPLGVCFRISRPDGSRHRSPLFAWRSMPLLEGVEVGARAKRKDNQN